MFPAYRGVFLKSEEEGQSEDVKQDVLVAVSALVILCQCLLAKRTSRKCLAIVDLNGCMGGLVNGSLVVCSQGGLFRKEEVV